jgi:hypothetical protein
LYICDHKKLPDRIPEKEMLSLIAVGEALSRVLRERTEWILFDEDTDLYSVWNQIIELFDRYHRWEREMLLLTGKQIHRGTVCLSPYPYGMCPIILPYG